MNVTIKNFQSIKNISFPFKGFTVIVGKNNIGKSAIVRAIEAALSNRSGSDFIRMGETSTRISLNMDALDVIWTKKKDTASYKVNEVDYTKLNRAIPNPILDAGFKRLEIGDQKLSPLFAPQFEPLFLLDKPGSVITEVLSTMYRLNIISKADDLCQKELRSSRSLSKTRTKDLEEVNTSLEVFEGFEDLRKEMEQISSLDKTCESLKAETQEIEEFIRKKDHIEKVIISFEKIKRVHIPNTADQEGMVQIIAEVQTFADRLNQTQKTIEGLKDITDISMPDYGDIDEDISAVEEIQKYTDKLRVCAHSLKKQKELFDILNTSIDLESSTTLFGEIEETEQLHAAFKQQVEVTRGLRESLESTEQQLQEKQKAMAKYENCPTCGKPL